MIQKTILTRSQRKGTPMDLSKVDRIHQALSATLVVRCTEESATPSEALTVGMRLFSHLLAAYVADADHLPRAMRHEIETHCRDAAAMTCSRLLELRDYEPFEEDDEESGPV
jgi:hypothetical protein